MFYFVFIIYGVCLSNIICFSKEKEKLKNQRDIYLKKLKIKNKNIKNFSKFSNKIIFKRKLDDTACDSTCTDCNAKEDEYWDEFESQCKKIIEGYFVDEGNFQKILKKCYPTCKTCKGEGNYEKHNCDVCNTDFGYFPKENEENPKNCFPKNQNIDHFYFDSTLFRKCEDGCLKCSNYSMNENYYKCEKCDYKKDYYPQLNELNNNRVHCMKYDEILENHLYLIGERYSEDSYIGGECYSKCNSCFKGGNEKEQNCIDCRSGFYKSLDDPTMCLCENFSEDNECSFSCSSSYKHKKFNVLFQGDCIHDCFQSEYKYIYNYQCFDECPNGTSPNYRNECIDQNKCVINMHQTKIELKSLNQKLFNSMLLSYMNEFLNNVTHIKYIYPEDNSYSITIYKNYECLRSLKEYPFSKLYINEECLSALRINEGISKDIPFIILIFEIKRDNYQPPQVQFLIYNSLTGNPVKDFKVCEEQYNITLIHNFKNMGIDLEKGKTLYEKYGINIFNESELFFTDKCKTNFFNDEYDMVLKDRYELFYQNFSFCDDECTELKKDYENYEVYCNCYFKTSLSLDIKNNIERKKIYKFRIGFLTFDCLKCYKQIIKQFYKVRGSIITLIFLFLELFLFIIYLCFGITPIKQFLGLSLKPNPPKHNYLINHGEKEDCQSSERKINKLRSSNIHSKIIIKDLNIFKSYQNKENEKKNNLDYGNLIQVKEGDDYQFFFKEDQKKKTKKVITPKPEPQIQIKPKPKPKPIIKKPQYIQSNLISFSLNIPIINNTPIDNKNKENEMKDDLKLTIIDDNKNKENPKDQFELGKKLDFSEYKNPELEYYNSDDEYKDFDNNNKVNQVVNQHSFTLLRIGKGPLAISKIIDEKDGFNVKYNMNAPYDVMYGNYIRLNHLNYKDAVILDHRSFKVFFKRQLFARQTFLYTFCYKNPLDSKFIRIIILLFKFVICILLNVICFTKIYISKKYHLQAKNNIKYYFKHGWIRLIISFLVLILIDFLIRLTRISGYRILKLIQIFSNKKKIERLVVQEFENILFLNILIPILALIIGFYTWFHVTCFSYVYKHSELDLFFGSLMTFLLNEIFQLLITIIASISRIFGLKHNSECSYYFSLFLTLE